jgi:hypothetical protein
MSVTAWPAVRERIMITMRNYALLLAGVCLVSAPVGAAEPGGSPAAIVAAQDVAAKERKEIKVTEKVLKTLVAVRPRPWSSTRARSG